MARSVPCSGSQVRSLRRLHETELQVLLRAMVVHDDGSGTLQVPDFVEAWRTLKASCSAAFSRFLPSV